MEAVWQFRFTPREKLSAVKEIIEGGRSMCGVARELGVSKNVAGRWRKKYLANPEVFNVNTANSYIAEMRQMRRRLAVLESQVKVCGSMLNEFSVMPDEKYAVIKKHANIVGVASACSLLGLPIHCYYARRRRTEGIRQRKDRELTEKIETIFDAGNRTYGIKRVQAALKQSGIHVGYERVRRLMSEAGLFPIYHKKKIKRGRSRVYHEGCPNLLKKVPRAEQKNRVWVSDFTYIWTNEGWLFLCCVIDIYSRRVVGHAMSSRIDRHLAIAALENAADTRRPAKGFILHSDQGSQYASSDFRQTVKKHGGIPSMSAKGCPTENAYAESFFNTLKTECANRCIFSDRLKAREIISQYIDFYNLKRIHGSLGFMSPADFENG
jgi:putative transposase